MKRIAFLMLVLALFVPRMAWAMHSSDHLHDSDTTAEHAHHDRQPHGAAITSERTDPGASDSDTADDEGFAHRHPAPQLLTFAALIPLAPMLKVRAAEQLVLYTLPEGGLSLARFLPPDRPPRTA
jgi:hypothetical protein